MKKKLLGTIACATACLALASCGGKAEEKETFVSLDINPAIELVVDENNVVVNAYATNTDAKVLFHGEKTLEGMKIDAAIGEIAKLSIDLGYLGEDNKVIEYTMSSNLSSNKLGKLEASINGSFEKTALEANLDVKVDTKGTFTLERQLENVKAKYPNNKDVQAMDEAKFKLVLSAMSTDFTLEFLEACKLTPTELIDLIQDTRDEAFNIATEVYNKAIGITDVLYQHVRNGVERTAYTAAYAVNLKAVNYGALYSLYGSAADTMEAIVNTAYRVEKYEKEILSNEQVQNIVAEIKKAGLKVDEALECLKDENGHITMDSVNAYLNKAIKNSDNKDLEAALKDLSTSVNELEGNINALVESIANEHKDEIKAIGDSIDETIKSIKGVFYAAMPEKAKKAVDAYVAELETLKNAIADAAKNGLTLEGLKGYINDFEAKEAELLVKINNDITDEQREAIDKVLEGMDNACAQAKSIMDKAMNKAREASEAQLDSMRRELIK